MFKNWMRKKLGKSGVESLFRVAVQRCVFYIKKGQGWRGCLTLAPSLSDLEDSLSYETVFENGSRTLTRVKVQGWVPEPTQNLTSQGAPVRRKRQVYGTDSRFSILDKKFLTNFPFNTAVKLSTGCSGILISPSHVLTAATVSTMETTTSKAAKSYE